MRFTKTLASATVAAVLGLAGVSVAGATSGGGSPQPSSTAATGAPGPKASTAATPGAKKAARAIRRRRVRRAAVLAAQTIGITPADLVKDLRAGQTIAEIATAHDVQPQVVITALENAATARIEAAKTANKITAERAARLETRAGKVIPKLVNNWHLHQTVAG
jgi:uncharacterized protein (DUF433 family)